MCPTKQPLLWRKSLSRLVKVKKTPHGCCVRDPSSPYLPSAWKIWYFCQRNQYSRTKRKPLGRFALHPSACGLGAEEEGRAGTDARELPTNFLLIPWELYVYLGSCNTTPKLRLRIKVAETKQFFLFLAEEESSFHRRVSLWGCPNFGGQ